MEKLIYSLDPINKTAKIVTSQSGCDKSFMLRLEDFPALVQKLTKRQIELRKYLGINKKQWKNRKYFLRKGGNNYKIKNKRVFQMALENGLMIETLKNIASELKNKQSLGGINGNQTKAPKKNPQAKDRRIQADAEKVD